MTGVPTILAIGESPDCIVCGHGTDVEAVATVRERFPDVPIRYWDKEPDGLAAATATRLGATEYVVPGALEGEALAELRGTLSRVNPGCSATMRSAGWIAPSSGVRVKSKYRIVWWGSSGISY
jgi:hypothetical protein